MIICPNLSDPTVKAQWDSLVSSFGKFEAMREFISSEVNGRPVSTPEQLAEKIAARETAPAVESFNNQTVVNEILAKSNDPVYDNPEELMGNAIYFSPIQGQTISVEDNSRSRAMELVTKLSDSLDIGYNIVSAEEAELITKGSLNPYKSGKSPAFFYGDTVYFTTDHLTSEMALHEFSHPLIRGIMNQNPELFAKLYESAINADPTLVEAAINEYTDLYTQFQQATDPETKSALEAKLAKIVAEEVLVKALTKSAQIKFEKQPVPTGLAKVVKDILYALKQFLRKNFGKAIPVSKLDENTTLDQLAEMLVKGDKISIDTENVTKNDVVAYYESNAKYVEDLKNTFKDPRSKELHAMIRRFYDGAKMQIDSFRKSKNYDDILDLFVDEYNRGDLQEIRANVSKYIKTLDEKLDTLEEEIDRTNNEMYAVVNNTMRLEVMIDKMEKHLKELKQSPDDRDNMHKAYYYKHFLDYWKKYVKEAEDMMQKADADPRSPMSQLLNSIGKKIEKCEDYINGMNTNGAAEVLWDQWRDMSDRADQLFQDKIDALKKKGASQKTIDENYKRYRGMTESEYNTFSKLKDKVERGDILTLDEQRIFDKATEANFNGQNLSQDKIARALRGEGKDANWANSYLEGYLYNTDPVIGGFALYYKNNMNEMEARAQMKLNEALKELLPLTKEAGITFTDIGKLGRDIGFIDSFGYYDREKKEFVKKEVWSLAGKFKDYRYDIDKLNFDIKELENRYNENKTPERKKALEEKLNEKRTLLRKWFHQEYTDEFYQADDILGDENDPIAIAAKAEKERIYEKMRKFNSPSMDEEAVLAATKEMDALYKELRLLYSTYYPNGQKKFNVDPVTGEVTNDLAIAERLQMHRDATRKFYEYKLRPGAFQNALRNFEEELRNKYPGDEGIFNELRGQWIRRNTRVTIKPEFYQRRSKILQDIRNITSKLPSAGMDFSEEWKTILDVVSGFRDDDGQPIGYDLPDGRRQQVKDAQEKMEAAKKSWAGFSGLTTDEMEELLRLTAFKNSGIKLTPDQWDTFTVLRDKQQTQGLNEYEKAELNSLFAELRELQRKEPTQYYVDIMNHFISSVDTDGTILNELGTNELDNTNVDKILTPEILEPLFDKSPEFKEWFMKNHMQKEVFDYETKDTKTVYERLYIWNVIKPNDPNMYEKTTVKRDDGTEEEIDGLPSLKYYSRLVKKEYRTGYDPATGEVKKIVGVHVSNRGYDDYLPKELPNSPYRNEKYYEIKDNNPKLFAVLEKVTEIHLRNQEGISKRGKLYLDFPRYTKSGLEVVQSKSVKGAGKNIRSKLANVIQQIKFFFVGAQDEAGKDFNWDDKKMLVRADAFDDQIENIPIEGMFNLSTDDTSTDILSSMFRYMYGIENHKQLVKMNPIAQGIMSVLEDPKNKIKEIDKINRANFVNFGTTTYLNKKGKYVRKDAFANFYNRSFLGETTTGAGKDWKVLQVIQKRLFGRASFAFFAFNFPSALKNALGAKFQALIHSAAMNDITPASLFKGEAWSMKYMAKLSAMDIYTKDVKSLEGQIADVFDPSQGRFKEKFGTSVTRTLLKDTVSTGWLYNFRKWTELQASMQTFAGVMYKKTVKMGGKDINYMDAWELVDGQLSLKKGIDVRYSNVPTKHIVEENDTVDSIAAKYYMSAADLKKMLGKSPLTIGKEITIDNTEFKAMRNRIHAIMNKLNGAYAALDQPEMQRYIAFRFVSFLRRYFTTMALNRFGSARWNPGYGEIDQGYYVAVAKSIQKLFRSGHIANLDSNDKRAWMKFVTEVGTLYLIGMLLGSMFGWDDEDEDRFEKLRKRSGHLEIPGTAKNPVGEEFDLGGFINLHIMNLMMQVRAENEQFIPWPGYGADNLSTVVDLKSLAFGPTTDSYQTIAQDLIDIWEDSPRQFYKRRAGAYEWQQQGGRKIFAHLAKMYGITGSNIAPADLITNFQKAQNLSTKK